MSAMPSFNQSIAHAALFKSSADDHVAPMHPGEALREDFLPHCRLSVEALARKLDVSPRTLTDLISERSSITPELASRLGEALGMSGRYWLALQLQYDLWQARVQAPDSNDGHRAPLDNRLLRQSLSR